MEKGYKVLVSCEPPDVKTHAHSGTRRTSSRGGCLPRINAGDCCAVGLTVTFLYFPALFELLRKHVCLYKLTLLFKLLHLK